MLIDGSVAGDLLTGIKGLDRRNERGDNEGDDGNEKWDAARREDPFEQSGSGLPTAPFAGMSPCGAVGAPRGGSLF